MLTEMKLITNSDITTALYLKSTKRFEVLKVPLLFGLVFNVLQVYDVAHYLLNGPFDQPLDVQRGGMPPLLNICL